MIRLVSACFHIGARSSGGRFGKRVNDAWVDLVGGEDDWVWFSGVRLVSHGDNTTSEGLVLVSGCGPTVAIALFDRPGDVQKPARVRLRVRLEEGMCIPNSKDFVNINLYQSRRDAEAVFEVL